MAKAKNEGSEIPAPTDGVQPGSIVKDAPDKPDPSSVAQVEVVKEFPPIKAV